MDEGADPKLLHGKASMAKLFCSEAAFRCADRAVQVFGGRGYMRTTAAERLWREVRVDRIWEGTSEIQRLIVARSLERRGVRSMIE
jgi:alkylation response protein AidB-like acyl-CoA dehydrogenase